MKKYLPGILAVATFASCKLTRSPNDESGSGSELASVGLGFSETKFPWASKTTAEQKTKFLNETSLKLAIVLASSTDPKCKAPDSNNMSGDFNKPNSKYEVKGLKLSDNCDFKFDLSLVSKEQPSLVYFKQKNGPSLQSIKGVIDPKTKIKNAAVLVTLCVANDKDNLFTSEVACIDTVTPGDTDVNIDVEFQKSGSPKLTVLSQSVDDSINAIKKSDNATELSQVFESDLRSLADVKSSSAIRMASIKAIEDNLLANSMVTPEITAKFKAAIAKTRDYLEANE